MRVQAVMGRAREMHDVALVGGGIGGLVAAGLCQRLGRSTVLFEAHTKLGGCAGYFERGAYTFDAGATALMGLERGEPLGDVLAVLGAQFDTVHPAGYRVHLPDRIFDLDSKDDRFEDRMAAELASTERLGRLQKLFWKLQQRVGQTLFERAAGVPRLPVQSPADLIHNLRLLGPRGVAAASCSLFTVRNLLDLLGLGGETRLHALLAILLEDTVQSSPERAPFANAAACLHAYRQGMRRPRGGMKAFVQTLAHRFIDLGGLARTASLVDRVQLVQDQANPNDRHFLVHTRRQECWPVRQVVFNLPLDLAARLLDRPLAGKLAAQESRSRARFSAFTGYVAIERQAVPDETPLFLQVLQSYDQPLRDGNNVLISIAPVEDLVYGPHDVRVATLSTHTLPEDWADLDPIDYLEKKREFELVMRKALERALPGACQALRHAEFASPRSFARYTRRSLGAVGGPPASRWNTNLLALGPYVLGPGLHLVGDSVFPGQGTMAVALSAIRVVEEITGVRWTDVRNAPAAPLAVANRGAA